MELILYYILECKDLLISFLILMFVIGVVCFLAIRNFNQEKRGKIIFYGIFSHMNNVDIVKLSSVLVRTFMIAYAISVTEDVKILISMVILILLTIVYIILAPKRIILELAYTMIDVGMVFVLYRINHYTFEVENSWIIFWIKMFFIIFMLLFNFYIFFKEIDTISSDRENKNIKKERKKQDLKEENIKEKEILKEEQQTN